MKKVTIVPNTRTPLNKQFTKFKFLQNYVILHLCFQTFHPETTDVYDKKNMPRVIYCLHALSTHLFKLGKAPLIQDLYGKVNFTGAVY
jgi:hypothetical protein